MCMGGVCTRLQPQRKRPLAHVMLIKRQRWGRWLSQCCNMVHLTATVTSSHCGGSSPAAANCRSASAAAAAALLDSEPLSDASFPSSASLSRPWAWRLPPPQGLPASATESASDCAAALSAAAAVVAVAPSAAVLPGAGGEHTGGIASRRPKKASTMTRPPCSQEHAGIRKLRQTRRRLQKIRRDTGGQHANGRSPMTLTCSTSTPRLCKDHWGRSAAHAQEPSSSECCCQGS